MAGTETKAGEVPEELPPHPRDRDVCFGESSHKATALLDDMILLYYVLLKGSKGGKICKTVAQAKDLAAHLTTLFLNGKSMELAALNVVPTPFLVGKGRFFEKVEGVHVLKTEEEAKVLVAKTIVSLFEKLEEEELSSELKDAVATLTKNCDPKSKGPDDPSSFSAPRPCDVLFLPVGQDWDLNMPYEHQTGNKHLLFLASLNVAADTIQSRSRVEAAFKLVTSNVEVNRGTELVTMTPRYVAKEVKDGQIKWRELKKEELAELACFFTYEVFLEKQSLGFLPIPSPAPSALDEMVKPSETPVAEPEPHDVLFGRGGMTNGHPGNRIFRDIIALHRPDYIRATKLDKPNVARRIVKAIRNGNPPGRFLKKETDDKWYDVGDRTATEKTSQGLRERSNAEKRQRSALRESLKIRKEDMVELLEQRKTNKKARTEVPITPYTFLGVSNITSSIPLSLSMKDKSSSPKHKKKQATADDNAEPEGESSSLPPNAIDKDGNILVTDYDILCGRGGLTNHHRGNKRFRDIVALHRPDYVRAPKIQKPSVARVIVRAIRNGDPPGRFLKKDGKTGKWVDIGDRKAAEKTSQALREKTGNDKENGDTPPASAVVLAPKADTLLDDTKDDDTDKKVPAKDDKRASSLESIEI